MSELINLRILAEHELMGREVLTLLPPATKFFWDHGNCTYLCGKCKCMLAEDVHPELPGNKVLKCNQCGSYNAVYTGKPAKKFF